jgi:hypothetical protein
MVCLFVQVKSLKNIKNGSQHKQERTRPPHINNKYAKGNETQCTKHMNRPVYA